MLDFVKDMNLTIEEKLEKFNDLDQLADINRCALKLAATSLH